MAYSDFDAFYLGLSLNMLDAGMKPADILWLLRHEKPSFENVYDSIMMTPRAEFRSHLAKSTPDSLSREENGSHNSDIRVFALLRKIELREVSPSLSNQSEDDPIFYVPVYCRGIEKLGVSLKHMGIDHRHVQIFELAHLAWDVKELLAEAPEVRRGRP